MDARRAGPSPTRTSPWRHPWWTVVVVATGAVAAGVTLTAVREPPTDPGDAIAALRASWGESSGVHFEGTIATAAAEPDDPGGDIQAPRQARVEGRLVMPDGGHWVLEGDDAALEVLVVPGGGYSRRAPDRRQLAAAPWEWVDAPALDSASTGAALAVEAGEPFGFKGFEPSGLAGMVLALGSPEEVAEGVYRAELPVSTALDHPYEEGELAGHGMAELTLAEGGKRLERMRWELLVAPEAAAGDEDDQREFATRQRVDVDLRFSRWNDAEPIREPVRLGT